MKTMLSKLRSSSTANADRHAASQPLLRGDSSNQKRSSSQSSKCRSSSSGSCNNNIRSVVESLICVSTGTSRKLQLEEDQLGYSSDEDATSHSSNCSSVGSNSEDDCLMSVSPDLASLSAAARQKYAISDDFATQWILAGTTNSVHPDFEVVATSSLLPLRAARLLQDNIRQGSRIHGIVNSRIHGDSDDYDDTSVLKRPSFLCRQDPEIKISEKIKDTTNSTGLSGRHRNDLENPRTSFASGTDKVLQSCQRTVSEDEAAAPSATSSFSSSLTVTTTTQSSATNARRNCTAAGRR